MAQAAIKIMFLEIGALKKLTKPWKVNAERFTFSSIEGWIPATALQANFFYKGLPKISIRFLVIF